MRKIKSISASALLLCGALITNAQNKQSGGYPITPVPFTSVNISDGFWGQRLEASRKVTIPLAFSKCEETGRYKNFENAAKYLLTGDTSTVTGLSFDDTDVYKTIEGASYSMQTYPDARLNKYIDSVLTIVAAAQEPDGYLYTSRTMNPQHPHEWSGHKRWETEEDLSHELYNLGHMVEGAIAHYQATGKRNFLDIAIKYADCVCREVGTGKNQTLVVPGHQIAEMALCKLYLATGDKKYLDEAKMFLDYKGKTANRSEYSQSHLPVIQQSEAVGHAVRAAYMYAGMADVAALTGDTSYIHAVDRIWNNIISKKYYITGGIGATASGEAFGENFELPNMSAYCETCAAIGFVYVNYRLFLLHGESKYYDALERTLYNGLISGVSLDGGNFFYPNPLESMGQHQRQPWFGCACCPSNICRFIPSVPGYIYAVKDKNLFVNLFISGKATINMAGKTVETEQITKYPYSGDISLVINKNTAGNFNLKIRIPGWALNKPVPENLYRYSDGKHLGYTIKLNGKQIESELVDGYFVINKKWAKGDKVDICFDLQPRTVKADDRVEADKGRISIERGPLVYCAEWPDNDFDIFSIFMNQNPKFQVVEKADKLYGITELITDGQILSYDTTGRLTAKDVKLTLIPYYSWNHRGAGKMMVWLPQDLSASRPVLPPTLASTAKLETSHPVGYVSSVCDRLIPKNADDRSIPYFHFWPKQNTTEWLTYTFAQKSQVSQSTVYWFDDGPWGGCRVPKCWKIYYKDDNNNWQEVKNADKYGTEKGIGNTVTFNPVNTSALKLEITQPVDNSTGLYEWEVK